MRSYKHSAIISVSFRTGSTSDTSKQSSSFSTATSNAQLARAFGICVREIAKLISATWQGEHGITSLSTFLELNYEVLFVVLCSL